LLKGSFDRIVVKVSASHEDQIRTPLVFCATEPKRSGPRLSPTRRTLCVMNSCTLRPGEAMTTCKRAISILKRKYRDQIEARVSPISALTGFPALNSSRRLKVGLWPVGNRLTETSQQGSFPPLVWMGEGMRVMMSSTDESQPGPGTPPVSLLLFAGATGGTWSFFKC
jgi:hypothetical protein